jgi:hypothetical protein
MGASRVTVLGASLKTIPAFVDTSKSPITNKIPAE